MTVQQSGEPLQDASYHMRMEKHRYEMSQPAGGGAWTIVVMNASGHEMWAGSGYITRFGAKRAARKVLRAKTPNNPAGVRTITGTL